MSTSQATNNDNNNQNNAKTKPPIATENLAKTQFQIEGMSCQACATRIEKVLNKKPAIDSASVSFAGETLNVSYDASQSSAEQISEWVRKTGFTAVPMADNQIPQAADKSMDWRLVLIWICMIPFLIGMAGMMLGQGMSWMPPLWIQFVLATFVQLGLAGPFYRSAWASIKGGLANMDVLVVIGTVTIWAYSTFIWLESLGVNLLDSSSFALSWSDITSHSAAHVPVYFEAGVMIIAFVKLGKYLEQRTKKHSLNSINMLLELTPTTVERLVAVKPQQATQLENSDAELSFEQVNLNEVQKGDVLRAKQGSRVATDGVVISGEGWCDESHLTGESIPVTKNKGDKVLAGAMVENGSLNYQVTAKGSDTQLSDMVKALSEAQGSKADLARLADKVAAVFVPVVVLIALVTFGLTLSITGTMDKAVLHAVSVLVIACPCALGLATPAAIMAGMGVAARHGVWFKDAQSLEMAGSVDTVVFDKTGTLTKGKPHIVDSMMVNKEIKANDVLQLAASVEVHVSHPLATAVVNAAQAKDLPLLAAGKVDVVSGLGVKADIEGFGEVKVGTAEFVGLTLPKKLPKVWQIASTIAVSVEGIPLGMFALADELKEESPQAVQALKQDGLEVVLLSGDKPLVVQQVADDLDIKVAHGHFKPRDKAQWIEAHQAVGHKVAMVGDGVNDAPAMATAYASFAMLEGTEVAKHSASARLMGDSIMQVHSGVDIAKATVRNIKQNLFFAFVYNCLGIPLAAFGLLNPMIAAAAMALSSISVLMNALRLTRHKV
ncbi:heavy metal translocating P-type ATPase [Psychrobacter phenylpyruvicus]|uniref:P-type Cu(2+) transporter n=1 Tax=Psychrobacter phenylpyruvicus TaxID=29432 RepID=A0A379LIF1_9GAMM|nr:cation-translocating P-type ATPase [Psychrobacter phenylpyruvicus]SUD90346.1 Copper-exporting P-type ATPase A [Psychrobacter phenylpyruvicus]